MKVTCEKNVHVTVSKEERTKDVQTEKARYVERRILRRRDTCADKEERTETEHAYKTTGNLKVHCTQKRTPVNPNPNPNLGAFQSAQRSNLGASQSVQRLNERQ